MPACLLTSDAYNLMLIVNRTQPKVLI